jgi:large subunit ribosomal protein L25
MRQANLSVQLRDGAGKGFSRRLRQAGIVPAILYGRKAPPVNLSLNPKKLQQLFHEGASSNTLFYLDIEGEKQQRERIVLLKEVQRDPVTTHWVHVDFLEIALDEPVKINIPIHFEGKAKGITDGGIVEPHRRELLVSCLPKAIPDFIAIDISHLGINDSLHVSDVKAPAGVKIIDSPTLTLVTVVPPAKEEVPVAAALPAEGVPVEGAAAPAEGAAAPAAGGVPAAKGAAAAPAAKAAPAPAKPQGKPEGKGEAKPKK